MFGALPLVLFLALQSASPSADYTRGKAAFERGEYARAIEILRPLLYPEPRLQSEGEIATAHRMLAVAHLFERQNDQAAQEFRKYLQLRPDYPMDSRLDPPLVVDFFNGILKQQEAELADLSRKREEAEADQRRRLEAIRNGPIRIERRFARNSLLLAFLPFGAGQFQNGQRTKGWVFLGTEAFLAGVSMAAFTTNFALYGLRPVIKCEETTPTFRGPGCSPGYRPSSARDRSQLLLKVQLVSGALFFAAGIWGVTDAVLNYQPEVEIPGPDKPGSDPLGKASISPSLVFAPLGDGSWGGALAFRF